MQEAGCSAFATLEEQAGPFLIPYLEPILQHLQVGFERFQHKNLLILYDAILTLADSVGPALNEPTYIDLLVPPLLAKWQQVGDEDRGLVSLLECLSSVAVALGPGFQPFIEPVYQRTHGLIRNTLLQDQQYQQGQVDEAPDKEFLVAGLDLMSGLIQALAEDINPLLANAEPKLVQMLIMCLRVLSFTINTDTIGRNRRCPSIWLRSIRRSSYQQLRIHKAKSQRNHGCFNSSNLCRLLSSKCLQQRMLGRRRNRDAIRS